MASIKISKQLLLGPLTEELKLAPVTTQEQHDVGVMDEGT